MENSNVNMVNALLVGAAGAGKSSFINSLINFINLSDKPGSTKVNSYIPTAKSQTMGGHTMTREPVQLTDGLTILDNRGWHDWDNDTAVKELVAQIHGHRPIDDDVNWDDSDEEDSSEDEESTIPLVVTEKVDCITIVLNGIGGIEAVDNITRLIVTCRQNTKRLPSIVITHKDEMSEEEIRKMMSVLENEHEIDPAKVFVVKNITGRGQILEVETKSRIRDFIESCLEDGKAGADSHKRREVSEKKREKQRELQKEKEIRDLQLNLRRAEISEAHALLESENESKKNMVSMREKMLGQEQEHTKRLHDMSEKQTQKVNEKELSNIEDLHKHRKACIKEFYDGQLRKIQNK